jgi:hypothetical protein
MFKEFQEGFKKGSQRNKEPERVKPERELTLADMFKKLDDMYEQESVIKNQMKELNVKLNMLYEDINLLQHMIEYKTMKDKINMR